MGYATDITDEEWGILEPFAGTETEGASAQTRLVKDY